MKKLCAHGGVTVWCGRDGVLTLVPRRNPLATTAVRDTGGVVAAAIRICAAKDRRRNEEKSRCR